MLERSYSDLNLIDVEDPKALARTMRAVDEGLVASIYDRFWGPGDETRTTATVGVLGPFHYLLFAPATAGHLAQYNTPVPPVWRGGRVRPTLYYSGSVASAVTSINWRLLTEGVSVGGVLNAAPVAHTASAPGPSAIGRLCSTTYAPLTIGITSGNRLLGVRIDRGPVDTYLGDAWFFGLLLQFFPARPSS